MFSTSCGKIRLMAWPLFDSGQNLRNALIRIAEA
jgi:hypothetical protein